MTQTDIVSDWVTAAVSADNLTKFETDSVFMFSNDAACSSEHLQCKPPNPNP